MFKSSEPTRDIFESGGRGIKHDGLRRANAKAVLTVVGFNSGVSNAEISRLSGLAPQTVSAILTELEQDGLVVRGPVLRGRRGQPATPILLDENGAYGIGVEIGWRHLDIVLVNMHARMLMHHHLDYAYPDAGSLFDLIGTVVSEFTARLTAAQRARLRDLGVAMPGGLADYLDLLDAPPEQAALWRTADPVRALSERTGLEVSLFNDGNAGCWAELIALDRPRPANVIYFLLSHYVAAGIVGDGVLWEGPTGNAANLGSMLVAFDADGPQEAHWVASLWALRRQLQRSGHREAHLPPDEWDNDAIGIPFRDWLMDSARALARVIFNATTVVEQPLVVLDTALSQETSARLVELVKVELDRLPARAFSPPRVIAGRNGRLGPAIGAAELPLFRRYF